MCQEVGVVSRGGHQLSQGETEGERAVGSDERSGTWHPLPEGHRLHPGGAVCERLEVVQL